MTGELAPEDPLWADLGVDLRSPVRVTARATPVVSGEIWVRGRFSAELVVECRRCLEPVEVSVDEELILLFAPETEEGQDAVAADLRPLPEGAQELDLRPAVREEFLLAAPGYVVCTPDCRGLCPRCGANRNREQCECTFQEPDPRWDRLRKLIS